MPNNSKENPRRKFLEYAVFLAGGSAVATSLGLPNKAEAAPQSSEGKEEIIPAKNVVQLETVGERVFWLEENGGLYAAEFDANSGSYSTATLVEPIEVGYQGSTVNSFDVIPKSGGGYHLIIRRPRLNESRIEVLYAQIDSVDNTLGLMEPVIGLETFDVGDAVCSNMGDKPFVAFTAGNDENHRYLYYATRVEKEVEESTDLFEKRVAQILKDSLIDQLTFLAGSQDQSHQEVWRNIQTEFGQSLAGNIATTIDIFPNQVADELIKAGLAKYSLSADGEYAWINNPVLVEGSKVSKLSVSKELLGELKVVYRSKILPTDGSIFDTVASISFVQTNERVRYYLPHLVYRELGSQDIVKTASANLGDESFQAVAFGAQKRVCFNWAFKENNKELKSEAWKYFYSSVVDLSVDVQSVSKRVVAVVTLANGEVWKYNILRNTKGGLTINEQKLDHDDTTISNVEYSEDTGFVVTTVGPDGISRKPTMFIAAKIFGMNILKQIIQAAMSGQSKP